MTDIEQARFNSLYESMLRALKFQAMKEQGWKVKENLPKKWVVDSRRLNRLLR